MNTWHWQWKVWIQRRNASGSTGTGAYNLHTAIERGIAYALHMMAVSAPDRPEIDMVVSAECPMCSDTGRVGQTARSKGRACGCLKASKPEPMTITIGADHYDMAEQGRAASGAIAH